MMTPFSHGFHTRITCVSDEGELQERALSCCNAPQEKGEPRHGRLAAQVPAAGVSSCHAPTARAAAVPAVPESQHGSVTKPNKSTFYQTPQLVSLPCPLLGTTWIWKLQYLLPVIKLFTRANNKKELLPQARVPSTKTWIKLLLLNISPAAAETDSNWIFFTHTLKPPTGTLACQKMAEQLTTAQLLWLSWITMQMRNAGSLSFTPITQLLTSPK